MYPKGKNRLYFQSNILVGEPVEIEFINPRAEKSKRFDMTYLEDGLYYIDIWLRYYGSYVMRAYYNGKKVGHSIIPVSIGGLIVFPDEDKIV